MLTQSLEYTKFFFFFGLSCTWGDSKNFLLYFFRRQLRPSAVKTRLKKKSLRSRRNFGDPPHLPQLRAVVKYFLRFPTFVIKNWCLFFPFFFPFFFVTSYHSGGRNMRRSGSCAKVINFRKLSFQRCKADFCSSKTRGAVSWFANRLTTFLPVTSQQPALHRWKDNFLKFIWFFGIKVLPIIA